jgi:hypothetical protein
MHLKLTTCFWEIQCMHETLFKSSKTQSYMDLELVFSVMRGEGGTWKAKDVEFWTQPIIIGIIIFCFIFLTGLSTGANLQHFYWGEARDSKRYFLLEGIRIAKGHGIYNNFFHIIRGQLPPLPSPKRRLWLSIMKMIFKKPL